MEYQHEYISEELSQNLNIIFAHSIHHTIYEEYHVIKAIDKCAEALTPIIYNQFFKLTSIQRVNETYFFTNWYIRSNILNNQRIEETVLTTVPTNHRIRFSFQKMNDDIVMQNLPRYIPYHDTEIEALRKKIFSENLKSDNPTILIHPGFMIWVDQDKNERKNYLTGMLGHELRHVIDQYILEFTNTLFSKKNSLNSDFKANNIFKIEDTDIYNNLRDIIYFMSNEEQQARIQATWQMCQNVIVDRAFSSQLVAAYNRTRAIVYQQQLPNMSNNFRLEITTVLRSEPFKYVHQLNMFRRIVNELHLSDKLNNQKTLLVLGYFLYRHNYIKNISTSDKNYFSFKKVSENFEKEKYSDEDKKHFETILKVINKNYQRFENIIYNIVGLNIERMFRYKSPKDNSIITFTKMAADNDLKLKPHEIGLIKESYHYYKETVKFFKRLNGLN